MGKFLLNRSATECVVSRRERAGWSELVEAIKAELANADAFRSEWYGSTLWRTVGKSAPVRLDVIRLDD